MRLEDLRQALLGHIDPAELSMVTCGRCEANLAWLVEHGCPFPPPGSIWCLLRELGKTLTPPAPSGTPGTGDDLDPHDEVGHHPAPDHPDQGQAT